MNGLVRSRPEWLAPNFAILAPELPFVAPGEVHLGAWNLPLSCALSHTVIWGAPRIGKSALAKLYAISVLQNVKFGLIKRAIFTDPKGEWLTLLVRFLGSDAVRYVQPLDRRGARWDAFAELDSAREAEALGAVLNPPPPHSDSRSKFFETGANDILGGLMAAEFEVHGQRGRLDNVLASTANSDSMLAQLRLAEGRNKSIIANYFGFKSPNRDVVTSVAQTMSPLRVAIESWNGADSTFTVRGALDGEYALDIGFSQAHPEAFSILARAILGRYSRLTLAERDSGVPKTFAFLDEIAMWGDLSTILPGWLALGPAKGVCAALTCQDFGFLRKHYGPELTGAMLGVCTQQFYFRLADVDSAEHASRAFGDMERVSVTQSINYSRSESGTPQISLSESEHLERVRAVPPEVFLGLDLRERGLPQLLPLAPPMVNELRFYASSPWLGTYTDSIHLDTLRRWLPPVADIDSDADTEPRRLASSEAHVIDEPSSNVRPSLSNVDDALPYR